MKQFATIILLGIFAILHAQEAYKVIDAENGKVRDRVLADDRGAFKLDAAIMGGEGCSAAVFREENDPTGQMWLVNDKGIIVIGCTKIRPEYPKDDTFIEKKIIPAAEGYRQMGKEFYTSKTSRDNGRLTFIETNTAFDIQNLDELKFVILSNGFRGKRTGKIRVDRHFVKDGFYIQVVGMSGDADDPADDTKCFAETACCAVAKAICSTEGTREGNLFNVNLHFLNATDDTCESVGYSNRAGNINGKMLSPGSGAGFGFIGFRPDEQTKVNFQIEGGPLIEKEFDLLGNAPVGFSQRDTIEFRLLEDHRIILVYQQSETEFTVIGMTDSEVATWHRNAELFKSAREGNLAEVAKLIDNGADVNYRIPFGTTPVVMAAGGGHLEIVQFLVEHGAITTTIDHNGYDIFHHSRRYPDVQKYLRELVKN